MFSLHIFSLLFSIGVILVADKQAFSWFQGTRLTLDERIMRKIHIAMWIGLVSLMATGFFLFYPLREYLFTQPLFIIKLLFVAILVTNGVLIGRTIAIAEKRSFASLTDREKLPLVLSGVLSAFAWAGAILVALVLFS